MIFIVDRNATANSVSTINLLAHKNLGCSQRLRFLGPFIL